MAVDLVAGPVLGGGPHPVVGFDVVHARPEYRELGEDVVAHLPDAKAEVVGLQVETAESRGEPAGRQGRPRAGEADDQAERQEPSREGRRQGQESHGEPEPGPAGERDQDPPQEQVEGEQDRHPHHGAVIPGPQPGQGGQGQQGLALAERDGKRKEAVRPDLVPPLVEVDHLQQAGHGRQHAEPGQDGETAPLGLLVEVGPVDDPEDQDDQKLLHLRGGPPRFDGVGQGEEPGEGKAGEGDVEERGLDPAPPGVQQAEQAEKGQPEADLGGGNGKPADRRIQVQAPVQEVFAPIPAG